MLTVTSLTQPFQHQGSAWVCASCLVGQRIAQRCHQQRRGLKSDAAKHKHAVRRDGKLPDFPARTRFAPSPTGTMHIGGLRTALYSYLLAKRTGGQFVLRIEDTDQKRFVPGSTERLCEDLEWAGIRWDEGPVIGGPYGPYQQSHRNDIYLQHAKELLAEDKAYRCFCPPQVAEASRSATYVTSGCYQNCSSLGVDESADRAEAKYEPYTVRLKPRTQPSRKPVPDLIFGKIQRQPNSSADSALHADSILVKSDGTPTYHFANVVDDHLMKITHVVRGTEWMSSTPLHVDLYEAFDWQPPLFAHVPLLVDKTGAKLSKRNADIVLDVKSLRDDQDILPETLVNFLALQGWSNPTRNDVMDMRELIEHFDLKFTTGNVTVATEKLWFLQSKHVAKLCEASRDGHTSGLESLVQKLAACVRTTIPDYEVDHLEDFCTALLLAEPTSFRDVATFVERNTYLLRYARGDRGTSNDPQALSITREFVARLRGIDTSSTGPLSERAARLEAVASTISDTFAELLWSAVCGTEAHEDKIVSAVATHRKPKQVASELVPGNDEQAAALLEQYRGQAAAFYTHMRWLLGQTKPGLGLDMVVAVLGREEALRRLTM